MNEFCEVVTAEDSIQFRNGGLYLPSTISGISHHRQASSTASDHQRISEARRRPRLRLSSQRAGTGRIASVAEALIPPASISASPERIAAGLVGPAVLARTSGMSTSGSAATGSSSEEIENSSVSIRGDSAYTSPAHAHGQNPGTPSRLASRRAPRKATIRIADSQHRCTIQGSSAISLPSRKNGPIGNR